MTEKASERIEDTELQGVKYEEVHGFVNLRVEYHMGIHEGTKIYWDARIQLSENSESLTITIFDEEVETYEQGAAVWSWLSGYWEHVGQSRWLDDYLTIKNRIAEMLEHFKKNNPAIKWVEKEEEQSFRIEAITYLPIRRVFSVNASSEEEAKAKITAGDYDFVEDFGGGSEYHKDAIGTVFVQ